MHRQYGEYDYFEFHYDVENIRIARSDQRDLLQDLQDTADGVEVGHAADSLKAAKEQKRARRAAAKARKIRKVEQMILTCGWDDLESSWQRQAKKLLDGGRIDELVRNRAAEQLNPAPTAMEQISMFTVDAASEIVEEGAA